MSDEEKYDLSVIIPTYNEAENIGEILRAIQRNLNYYDIKWEIIVVDDNSPDGTMDIVQSFGHENIRVLVRTTDRGLSQSVVHGFKHAKSDICVVMDADFSHPPQKIYKLYKEIKENGADISLGCRYMPGGEIKGWGLDRTLISGGATALARILFPCIRDPGSGFFAIRKSILEGADLRPTGYKMLIEILGKCKYDKVVEIPFKFINRRRGSSKLGKQQIFEFIVQMVDIIVHASTKRDTKVWKEFESAIKFAAVGTSGIFVNLMMLYLIVEVLSVNYLIAGVIATECAIISNFSLNDKWTFSNSHNIPRRKRFLSFQIVSIGGLLINFVIYAALTALGLWYMFAQLIGIFIAFAWNFVINRRKTWSD